MAKIEYKKTLQACYPEIAAEWHPTLNGKLTPEDVHNGGSAKVYWLCPNGHTYQKLIAKRTRMGQGCPQCRIEKNAFANVHPELLEYWDYEKNEGINPKTISYGSAKEVWWKCPKGHSYMQTLHSKSAGAGCLICTRQIVSDETSLLAERTDIVAEWHPTKNIGLVDGRGFDISTPDKVTVGSRQKVWWLCPNGHEYPAIIYSRKRSGCPICDSEKRTSFPEQAIQYYLNKLFVAESRFQIGGFEADIYCPSLKVAIEYDGEYFHQGDANDAREERKNEFFIEQGILLFRIKESREKVDFICHDTNYGYLISTTYIQDYYFISDVISSILDKINARFNSDYDIDVNIIRDKVEIISLYAQQKEENSFLMQKPLGAQKWDYEKNGDIDLRLLPRTSKKKYWWKCPTCGNQWYGSLDNIVNSLTCNKCTRQVKAEIDMAPEIFMDSSTVFRELNVNLQTQNPELAAQWHPTKNGYFKPIHVTPKSGKRVWWLCPECKNEWPQYIKTRNNGKGARKCPVCVNNQKKENTDALEPFMDILFDEWHPTKNGSKKLTDYTPGSTAKVWWKCSKCGTEYESPIKTRKKVVDVRFAVWRTRVLQNIRKEETSIQAKCSSSSKVLRRKLGQAEQHYPNACMERLCLLEVLDGGLRMSINLYIIRKYMEDYPTPTDCRMKSVSPNDALPSYEYLESIRFSIPKELYAYNLRALLQCNTENVSPEMRLRMLDGVSWEDIMYQDELDAIEGFEPLITIYRGTDPSEEKPGLSWALRKSVADSVPFNRGRVFKAIIPKEDILVYLAHEEDETEIIANVTSGYTIIE